MSGITLTNEQFTLLLQAMSQNNNQPKQKPTFCTELLEDRINAIDIEQFMESITIDDIELFLKMNRSQYFTHTLMKNLGKYEKEQYPFVCANPKLMTYYYKTNGEWKKGSDFITEIAKLIEKQVLNQLIGRRKSIDADVYQTILSSAMDSEHHSFNSIVNKLTKELINQTKL